MRKRTLFIHNILLLSLVGLTSAVWCLLPNRFGDDGPAGALVSVARADDRPNVATDSKDTAKTRDRPARVRWTASRVVGSPEPPSPYRLKRVFPKLKFDQPVHMLPEPGTNRLWIMEHKSKIRAIANDNDTEAVEDVADLTLSGFGISPYGLVFHPDYVRNGLVFAFLEVKRSVDQSNKDTDKDKDKAPISPNEARLRERIALPEGVKEICRVSRFETTRDSPRRIIRDSEQPVIEWTCSGHTGGGMGFGADGFLYVTTGDGTGDSDGNVTGQDMTDLQGGVVRIDVDNPDQGRAYSVPKDNPFLHIPEARPELYAIGLRAPWRMTYDPPTGQFWIGEVGQDLWEQIHLLQRGANYGWSVREGHHPFHAERRAAPIPFTGPIVEHHHSVARSITGGYVYRGSKRPELQGHYIYCDYETGKVWSFRYVDGKVLDHQELTDTSYKIPAFGIDHAGELFLVAYSGEIFELEPRPTSGASAADFPRRLSETGLFSSTAELTPAPGLIPYSVNAPVWADGARMDRFIAIPDDGQITFTEARGWNFPEGTVLVQTVFIDQAAGNAAAAVRLETRILTRQDSEWVGYSYLWNDDQTDAALVDATGTDRTLQIKDAAAPQGTRRQTWHIPSRSECMGCHSRAANWVLGVSTPQINRNGEGGSSSENQLAAFEHSGLFEKPLPKPPAELPRLVDPRDRSADLTARARAYLHVNCSTCHVAAGGGNARLELELAMADDKTMLFADALHGVFGLPAGKVVARGEPCRSVLLYRISKIGSGRMPHLGSSVVDTQAAQMIFDWIASLPADDGQSAETANRLAAERRDVESLRTGRADDGVLDRLLTSTSAALLLVDELSRDRLDRKLAADVIRRGAAHADPAVRDLFERFLPEEERVPRLGPNFDPKVVLDRAGNAADGETLFFNAAGLQCQNCHVIKGRGTAVGPELSTIGKQQTAEQLLQSLIDPSKIIDEKFRTWVVETKEGRTHTGLLVEKTDRHVALRDAQNQITRIPSESVEMLIPQTISLMPTMLLRDLTPQQAADLVEYLRSLK